MMGHPGKKLLFMGQEFGQLREWSEERDLTGSFLQKKHQQICRCKDLLHIYKKYPALYELDNDPKGFEWINADDVVRSIFSFTRHSKERNNLLFVCNFTPVDDRITVLVFRRRKQFKLVLNSDETKYGGSGEERP